MNKQKTVYSPGDIHRKCIICGVDNPYGLRLVFHQKPDKEVEAECKCNYIYEGYPGIVQGGIVASLLDSAMTNCLFAQNIITMTGRLEIRFKKSVRTERLIKLRAWPEKIRLPFYYLNAEIYQDGKQCVVAKGCFKETKDPLA